MPRKLCFKQLPLFTFLFVFSCFTCSAEEVGTDSISNINKSFSDVVGLETKGLGADVTIAMSKSKNGQLALNIASDLDDEELNARIKVSEKDGTILIQDNANYHTQSRNYTVELPFFGKVIIPFLTVRVERNNSSVLVSNGSEGDATSKLNVSITLPSDANLKLGAAAGRWKILGDVQQNFKLNMHGIAEISVDKLLSGANVSASGAGKFTAKEITGERFGGKISGSSSIEIESLVVDNSSLSVSGIGQINVKGGHISKELDARISRSGQVSFEGLVKDLNASISGVGYISVGAVKGHVNDSVSGLGKINVKKRLH
jgi:hypothetical protein